MFAIFPGDNAWRWMFGMIAVMCAAFDVAIEFAPETFGKSIENGDTFNAANAANAAEPPLKAIL